MGLERIRELAPFVKEALQQSLRLAKFFCCVHVIIAYLCTFAYAVGPSMLPTFNLQGNLVLAERSTTRFGKVGSGDVVLIRCPDNPRKVVIKRVKGVEGNVVSYLVDPNKSDEQRTAVELRFNCCSFTSICQTKLTSLVSSIFQDNLDAKYSNNGRDNMSPLKEDSDDINALLSIEYDEYDDNYDDDMMSTARTEAIYWFDSPDSCSNYESLSIKSRPHILKSSGSRCNGKKHHRTRKMINTLKGIVPGANHIIT